MTEAERTRQSYDTIAGSYARELADELRHKPLDRALLTAFADLAAGGPVADVGCGPGHVAAYLVASGLRCVGVDVSPAMCATVLGTTSLPAVAGDMTALPVRSGALSGLTCLYAVIHLDTAGRRQAYAEFARVLRAGGHALVAVHCSDPDAGPGTERTMTDWWGHPVALTFRFLDPDAETAALAEAGLHLVARLDRAPHPGVEHPSRRSYLLTRRQPADARCSVRSPARAPRASA